jgi:hypothetical protein
MPSNAIENAAKSTKLIDIPPLITVWLQVRVLPGPPAFARFARFGWASQCHKHPAKRAEAVTPKPWRGRTGLVPNQNIENNPMQSSTPVASKAMLKPFDTSGKSAA